jgi:hypothetical protein
VAEDEVEEGPEHNQPGWPLPHRARAINLQIHSTHPVSAPVRLGSAATVALADEIAGAGGAPLRLTLFRTGPACRVPFVGSVASCWSVFEGACRSGRAWPDRSPSQQLVPSLVCPPGRPARTASDSLPSTRGCTWRRSRRSGG